MFPPDRARRFIVLLTVKSHSSNFSQTSVVILSSVRNYQLLLTRSRGPKPAPGIKMLQKNFSLEIQNPQNSHREMSAWGSIPNKGKTGLGISHQIFADESNGMALNTSFNCIIQKIPFGKQAGQTNLSGPLGSNPFVYVSVSSFAVVTHDIGITTNFYISTYRVFQSQKLVINNKSQLPPINAGF